MLNPKMLKSVNSDTTIYPNVKACVVTCIGSDNKEYEATVPKEEVELALYLKQLNIKPKQLSKLTKMIEEYGDVQYDKGGFNESYNG